MNAALMLVKDNAFIVGFIFAAWAIWKVARWTNNVDASIQRQSQTIDRQSQTIDRQSQNIERLTESVQNLTNNFSRLDTRVAALSEKIDTRIADLSEKIDTRIADLSEKIDTRIADLSEKIDTRIADLSASMSKTMDAQIATLSDKIDTQVATLSDKIDTQVAALSKTMDTQVATLSKTMDTQVATLSKTMDTQIATLSDTIDTRHTAMSEKVDGLQSIFTVLLDRQTAKSASPRTLTDYGAKLSLEIDAPSLAAYYAARLREKTGSMNAWQIQELCFNHAEHEIMKDLQQHDIDRYNQITMCAYREGIDLSQIMRVVGIVMRDQLLQQTGQLPSAQTAPAILGGDSTLRNIASLTGQTANQEA